MSIQNMIVAAVAVSAVSAAAWAGTGTLASDADFITLQNGGGFTKQFGGNVRWGNGASNGDWEYAIVDGTDTPIGGVGQATWAATNSHRVTFSFDALAGTSTLDLSGIGAVTRSVSSAPTVIWARVQDSVTPFSALSNIQVDLAYNGVGVDYSFDTLTGDADAAYWGVFDANLAGGFTLTADAQLDGPRSGGSSPLYQFKVGVPTPGAAAIAALGVLAAGRRRR